MAPQAKKERLTITLSPSILKKVDRMIDKKTIRNRSHAIEYILNQHILSKVTKVVVLAGGKGTKMGKLAHEYPKVMLPVNEKPLIEHTIMSLVAAGLKDIILVTGHLGSKIERYFEDGSRFGAHISYITDLEEKGTAHAISLAKEQIGDEPFLLVYGDVLAQVDWLSLIEFHDKNGSAVTMAVTTVTDTEPWGTVGMEGNYVVRFNAKQERSNKNSHMINSGIYVVNPAILKSITSQTASFEEDVLCTLTGEQELCGYPFSGKWFDVGSAEVYKRATESWQQ